MGEREDKHGKGETQDWSAQRSAGKDYHTEKDHVDQADGNGADRALVDLFTQVLLDVRGNLQPPEAPVLGEDARKAVETVNQILSGLLRPGR